MKRILTAALTAALLSALLTGCYKGDGTENISFPTQTVPVQTSPNQAEIEASFTDVTRDPNAPTDLPFAFEPVTQEPQQDILLALLFDNTESPGQHTQAINYFDKAGNCYRYRDGLDVDGDWLSVLQAHLKTNPLPVSIASEAELQSLRYLAAHAADYEKADNITQSATNKVVGVTWVYAVGADNTPVLLCRYDDTSVCRKSSEVTSFLNWFSYFFHPYVEFGEG